MKVKLGKQEIELSTPASYAVRHEVVAAGASNVQRAFAAALGVCAPRVGRMLGKQGGKQITYEGCQYQPLRYGGELIDGLVAVSYTHLTLPTKA